MKKYPNPPRPPKKGGTIGKEETNEEKEKGLKGKGDKVGDWGADPVPDPCPSLPGGKRTKGGTLR